MGNIIGFVWGYIGLKVFCVLRFVVIERMYLIIRIGYGLFSSKIMFLLIIYLEK